MSHPAVEIYRRHRLTVHDFHRMGEAGILPVAGRMELIAGEIMDEALKITPDGRITNGNTRIKVLEERGFGINSLPREVLP